MKLAIIISISVITFTLCSAIRVPTSWSSTPADRYTNNNKNRHPPVNIPPSNTHRFSFNNQQHVNQEPNREIPKPIALAHQKYVRNKDAIKKTPLQVDNRKKVPLLKETLLEEHNRQKLQLQNKYSSPIIQSENDWVPIAENRVNKRNYGQSFVAQNAISHPHHLSQPRLQPQSVEVIHQNTNPPRQQPQRVATTHHNQPRLHHQGIQSTQSNHPRLQPQKVELTHPSKPRHQPQEAAEDVKPVYEFDTNFQPIVTSSRNTFFDNTPKNFFDEFKFLPLPKPRDPYEERKERILLTNYRDDKTHEPSEEHDTERDKEDEKEQEELNEEDDKAEVQKDEEAEEDDDEEEEKASISEHEAPAEVPTRPIYPGEGKWAQRGLKHRPFISSHEFTELENDEEKPEGHDVFDRAQDVFERQSNRFSGNLAAFPGKHKLGHYIKPTPEESEPVKQDAEEEDDEELEDEDEDFVPTQVYSQVRRTEDEEHLPPVYEGPAKLREVIKDSKIQTVYTEEGYEDIAYDHAGHEKEAAENQGFAEAEEEVEKEKQKKAPRKKFRLESPGDSIIEESNYDNSKSVVSPNGVFPKEELAKIEAERKPIIRNNNNFVKTKEIKTTAVKDNENGQKEMEVLSEIKIMMVPNSNGTKLHKFVKVLPKNYKLPKKIQPEDTSSVKGSGSQKTTTEQYIPTTLQPQTETSPDILVDAIPLPTTSTEALPFLGITKSPPEPQSGLSTKKENNKGETTLSRKKRFTNDFEKFEIDTAFIDKINHTIPIVVDRTHEKYPYYFMKNHDNINKNSALRYAEDLKNAPQKAYGEMTFYEQAQNTVPCEEVESDVDPLPDRVKDAEKNAEEMKESDDIADLAPAPRLQGLGDKIRCFKKRYFGENPLDSPFFKEDLIPAVTPPYRMPVPHETNEHQPIIQRFQATNQKQDGEGYRALQEDVSNDSSVKSKEIKESKNDIEDKDEQLSENASNLSEKSSEGILNEENEVDIDDPRKPLKASLNRYEGKYDKYSEPETKDDYSGLETFEDDSQGNDEDRYEYNEDFDKKLSVKNNDEGFQNEKLKLDKNHPTKFTLTIGDKQKTKSAKTTEEEEEEDEVGLNLFQDIISRLLSKSNTTKNETFTASTTPNPDAEVVDVNKLPVPIQPPVISIITTPKYTIDLVPKHIYDQIELLRYLPNQEEVALTTTTEKVEVTTLEDSVPKTDQSIKSDFNSDTNTEGDSISTNTESNEDNSREPKILVKQANPKIDDESVSEEQDTDNKPESQALRSHRRKQKRKRPFVVFDVNRFWPTTPFPLFEKPIKHRTVLPKHKVHSQVHYKDEIKPSEQLNVLTDVLNIIKNSTAQDPLMVAESHNNNNFQYNKARYPVRQTNYETVPNNYQNYPLNNVPQKISLNTYLANIRFPLGNQANANRYPQPQQTKINPKRIKQEARPAVIPITPQNQEEISTKLKNNLKQQLEEEDEIDYYTSQDITKLRPQDIDSSGSTSIKSSVTVNRDESKSSERQENIDYIQEPMTEVLGLVPPGSKHYRTIYKTKSQRKQPTSIYSAMEEAPVNKFYVLGMKPPPKSQDSNLYSDLKIQSKARRRFHIRRSKRQTKPYTELVRSRGPQFESETNDSETKKTDEDDDYVPHRPKNYHYDEKTGKIIYDNVSKDENQDEEDVEYAVVYEEVTEKPVSTSTVSWIATAKPNKDEKPLLFFVEKLKGHPDYKLIPDPIPTEKSIEPEVSAQNINITVTPLSTEPPPFLNIIEKLKSDSNYKLIPDKTTDKSTTTTITNTQAPLEEEEVIEEAKIENLRNSPEEEEESDESLSGLIFDISEFLPKTKIYQPRTPIDYSKYKTIERPQVNTRHNLSSRYNAETDKQLQEVNTKKVPILQTTGSGSEETQVVSESRIEEQTPGSVTAKAPSSTEKTHRGGRRRSRVTSTTPPASSTTITSSLESSTSTTFVPSESSTIQSTSTESLPVSESSTSESTTVSGTTPTTSTTITTTSTTTTTTERPVTAKIEEQSTSSPRRVRIRGRIRSSTVKTSLEESTTARAVATGTTSRGTTTEKANEETTQKKIRRRPARIKVRTSTEKYFGEEDVDKSAKVVRRRQQSARTFYESDTSTLAPWRFAPIIVENNRNDQNNHKIQESSVVSLANGQLYIPVPRGTLTPPGANINFQQNPTYLGQPIPLLSSENVSSNPTYKDTYSIPTGNIANDPLYRNPLSPSPPNGNIQDIPILTDSYGRPLTNLKKSDGAVTNKQLLTPLEIGNIPSDLTYNQPYIPLRNNPYLPISKESSAEQVRDDNQSYLSPPKESSSIPQEERINAQTKTSKQPLFAPVTIDSIPYIATPTSSPYKQSQTPSSYTALPATSPSPYSQETLENIPPSLESPRHQGRGRGRSRINRLPVNQADHQSGFISSTAQPFTSVTLQGLQNTPQSRNGDSYTTHGISTTEAVITHNRRRQKVDNVDSHNLDALIAPLIAVSSSTEQPEINIVPSTNRVPETIRTRGGGRQRNSGIESRNYNVPIDAIRVREFSGGISSPAPFSAVSVGSTLAPIDIPKPQIRQRISALESIGSISATQDSPKPQLGRQRISVLESIGSTLAPQDSHKPQLARQRISALDSIGSTLAPQEYQGPQLTRQRVNGLESRKLNTVPNIQPRTLEVATFPPLKQPSLGPPVVLDFFTSTTTQAPKPIRRRRPRIKISKSVVNDSQKSGTTNPENRESRRIRGGNVKRQPERRRGNIVQQVRHQKDSSEESTEPSTTSSHEEDFKDYYIKHKHKHYRKEDQEVPSRRRIDSNATDGEKTQSRNVNVEVFRDYNKAQRHGGNLRSADDVSHSSTINSRNQKIVADSEKALPNKVNLEVNYNPKQQHGGNYKSQDEDIHLRNINIGSQNRDQNINSNVNVFKTYDAKQRHGGNFNEENEDPEFLQPVISNEPLQNRNQDSIQTQNVNVEAFKDYNINQNHGGNYKNEEDAEIIGTGLVHTRNERVVLEPGRNQNQNPNVEVIKNYNQNQRHGGNYKDNDNYGESLEPNLNGKKDGKLIHEPEKIQTKNINVEVFKDYDLKQKHGGNYRSENQDSVTLETSTIGSRNEKNILDRNLPLGRQTNAGILYNAGLYQDYDSSEEVSIKPQITRGNNRRIVDSERNPPPKVNVEVFKDYNPLERHVGNYRRREDSEDEATVHSPPSKPRRRRPLTTTTSPPVDYESLTEGRRNNLRRRDPSIVRGNTDFRIRNNLELNQKVTSEVPKLEENKHDTQEAPSKQDDVEAFQEHDKNRKHGGNYKSAQEEESKQAPSRSPDSLDPTLDVIRLLTIPLTSVISSGAKQFPTQELPSPAVQGVTERLTSVAPEPFAFYNDPRLAKNVNQLKDLTIPEAVTEELVDGVAQEDPAEDEYGDLPLYLGNGPSATSTPLPAINTAKPVTISSTTTNSLPKIIKDPSKRLYFYASV